MYTWNVCSNYGHFRIYDNLAQNEEYIVFVNMLEF